MAETRAERALETSPTINGPAKPRPRGLAALQLLAAGAGLLALLTVEPFAGWNRALMLLFAALTLVFASAILWPEGAARRLIESISGSAAGFVLGTLLLVGGWTVGAGLMVFTLRWGDLRDGGLYAAVMIVWPLVTLGLWFALSRLPKGRARGLAGNLAVMVLGTVLCLVLLEGLLQLAFDRVPPMLKVNMPQAPTRLYGVHYETESGAREYTPGEVISSYEGGAGGDMFFKSCLTPAQAQDDTYLVQYTRDEHGFRNASPWPDQVDLVVTGDSFTMGGSVQRPYWQNLPISTLALGMDATGNAEQTLLVRAYGLPRQPRVVMMAFYEGNDLTGNFEFVKQGSLLEGYNRWVDSQPVRNFLVTFQAASWVRDLARPASGCHWPITDNQGRQLAFLEEELSILTVDREQMRQSEVFQITRDAVLGAAAEAQDAGAAFVLAYIPTKMHAYWNGLSAEQIETVAAHVTAWELPETGYYQSVTDATAADVAGRLTANYEAQRDLLAELAEQNGFQFLDLTIPLQAAIDGGESPYFFGDSHWNQAGHDLVHEILLVYLVEQVFAGE